MVKGRTRAAAQDEQGRALARGVVVLWYMVQQVHGVWAVVALALCAVVCTSRCLAARLSSPVLAWRLLNKTGEGFSWSEAYEKQRTPFNYL